uniref:Uncharacterized protein n=1 Tax=Candidatus Kentrum sp. MB TaxID=2138164 RepID=A0A450XKW1_9GAMM|nr:MAG: hypothetical protein BECKMB1821G_GA0114241_101115 [Candidatus Kentron sp. MB]VFK29788.1 MAG: hypothetical protein BECKMB1821I_GA0114274_10124 [Candidatus Kentron sp. MB]VFK74946.1 MAG: hypothetical protein BECKMB1821H_GA0114242_10134 [Candidatus Kentron sp. MB]
MFIHRMETMIARKGVLHLEALPFESGDKVEITILKTGHGARATRKTHGWRVRRKDSHGGRFRCATARWFYYETANALSSSGVFVR